MLNGLHRYGDKDKFYVVFVVYVLLLVSLKSCQKCFDIKLLYQSDILNLVSLVESLVRNALILNYYINQIY